MPPTPAKYTPGSTVTTFPEASVVFWPFANRGSSCTSNPKPCPVLCTKYWSNPYAASTFLAAASTSPHVRPLAIVSIAADCASSTAWYHKRIFAGALPTYTVRVMSLQYFPSIAPRSSTTNSFFLKRLAVGRACGSAARDPNATMLSNAAPDAPRLRIWYSISAATSNSRIPGFSSLIADSTTSLASTAAFRIWASSDASFTARSLCTIPEAALNPTARPAAFRNASSCPTVTCCASNPTLLRVLCASSSPQVRYSPSFCSTTVTPESSCSACTVNRPSVTSVSPRKSAISSPASPVKPVK